MASTHNSRQLLMHTQLLVLCQCECVCALTEKELRCSNSKNGLFLVEDFVFNSLLFVCVCVFLISILLHHIWIYAWIFETLLNVNQDIKLYASVIRLRRMVLFQTTFSLKCVDKYKSICETYKSAFIKLQLQLSQVCLFLSFILIPVQISGW